MFKRWSSAAEVSPVRTFPEKSSTEDECAKTVLIVCGRAQPNTPEQALGLHSCLRLEELPRSPLSHATGSPVQLSVAREDIPRDSLPIFHMACKTDGKRVHLASSKKGQEVSHGLAWALVFPKANIWARTMLMGWYT